MDDIGDCLGLYWIDCPQEGGEGGNKVLIRLVAVVQNRASQKQQDGEIKKQGCGKVNGDIYHVITQDVILPPEPVQRETQAAHRTIQCCSGCRRMGKEGVLDRRQGQLFQMNGRIENDVVDIVQMPGTIQAVQVRESDENQEQEYYLRSAG